MVGSTSSPHSFSLSLSLAADDHAGPATILKGALPASALVPRRRNGWTSRAVRARTRARAHTHPGLIPDYHRDPVTVGDHNNDHNDHNNNSVGSLSGGDRPASDSSPAPAAPQQHPTAAGTTRAPSSSVPVLAITCGAVGGIIVLAVVLALVYVRRIRRRVKSMKRRTNVLGPELVPMSPSQMSQMSTIDSPRVKFDGKHILPPQLQMTSELTNHLPPLSAVSVSSPTSTLELPVIPLLSPIRTSTFILSPPPAAAKRSTIRSSNPDPDPYSNPRSPIYSSRATVPWPFVTALSSRDHPQHDYEERNTSSDTSGSTDA